MNGQRIFPGILLIGFGLYFFLQHSAFTWIKPYLGWPALLLITGFAFLAQGLKSDGNHILPGVVLTGFGLHFYVVDFLGWWAHETGVFILIIAVGFFIQHQKTGSGLLNGILFLLLASVILFYETIKQWFSPIGLVWQFWPLILIAAGGYLLFVQKNGGYTRKKT
ncbi:hypothetical protein [Domibacillus indicus]|uniref:hypothetical protein n=1 Tax=Domibacillus indicus TaxID=1437523 RepID=UPI0006182773|nr:hypothetical protein [Domibacillus indicus]